MALLLTIKLNKLIYMRNETTDKGSINYIFFKVFKGLLDSTFDRWLTRLQYIDMTKEEISAHVAQYHLNVLERDLEKVKNLGHQLSEEQKAETEKLKELINARRDTLVQYSLNVSKKSSKLKTHDYMISMQERFTYSNIQIIKEQAIQAGLSPVEAHYYIIDALIPDIMEDISKILHKKTLLSSKKPLTVNKKKIISESIETLSNLVKIYFDEHNFAVYASESQFLANKLDDLLVPYLEMYNILSQIYSFFNLIDEDIQKNIIESDHIIKEIQKASFFLKDYELTKVFTPNQTMLYKQVMQILSFLENRITKTKNEYLLQQDQRYLQHASPPAYTERNQSAASQDPPPEYSPYQNQADATRRYVPITREITVPATRRYVLTTREIPVPASSPPHTLWASEASIQGASANGVSTAEAPSSSIGAVTSIQGASANGVSTAEAPSFSIGVVGANHASTRVSQQATRLPRNNDLLTM